MKYFTRLVLFFFLIIFTFLYLHSVNTLSGSGEKILQLRQELARQEKENRSFSLKLSSNFRLYNIDQKAKEIGMIDKAKFVYLKKPVALVVSKR